MFIFVTYRDMPQLSSHSIHQVASATASPEPKDMSIEKTLLVNPQCPVRIMLEYIRKQCKLGLFTEFDLCDDSGVLKNLFDMQTYEYATHLFEHKRVYYIVVIRQASGKMQTILQLNHENRLYEELRVRIHRNLYPSEERFNKTIKSSTKSIPMRSTSRPMVSGKKKNVP